MLQAWIKAAALLFLLELFKTAHGRPNVLFLVVDDLRPKLGCYGESNMVTPNIDQLAAKSIRFERAYVQQAVCSPSRTSFLTGRRPDSTRIFDLYNYFRDLAGNYTTLPQHFKNNGYISQSSGKIFHPGHASGMKDDYPYSWSNLPYHSPAMHYYNSGICPTPNGLKKNAVCPVDVSKVPLGTLADIQNTDFSIDFLKNRSEDGQPFFLGMGYHRPHLPFQYPKEYLDLYPMSKISLAPNPFYPPLLPTVAWSPLDELMSYDDIAAFNLSYPFGFVPMEYQLKLRQSYSAAASFTDAQLGRLLNALDEYGLSNNTVISFHGDHGWQLGDHGEWCKHTNFDIATRIPMLVHVPGVTSDLHPTGRNFPYHDALDKSLSFKPESEPCANNPLVSDAFVEAVDLYPTLSELAGLEIPSTCPDNPFHVELCTEGASLVPIIKNLTGGPKTMNWKPAVFSQFPRPDVYPNHNSMNPVLVNITIMGYTMRTVEYRYTEWIAYDHTTFTADWNKIYAKELYIYESDPLEDVNVADVSEYHDLTVSLSKQLKQGWRSALPKPNLSS